MNLIEQESQRAAEDERAVLDLIQQLINQQPTGPRHAAQTAKLIQVADAASRMALRPRNYVEALGATDEFAYLYDQAIENRDTVTEVAELWHQATHNARNHRLQCVLNDPRVRETRH